MGVNETQINVFVEAEGMCWWECVECHKPGGSHVWISPPFGSQADAFYHAQVHGRQHPYPVYELVDWGLMVEYLKATLIRLKEDCGR